MARGEAICTLRFGMLLRQCGRKPGSNDHWTDVGTGVLPSLCDRFRGSSSAVERQLPKLDVAGSIPVSRSILPIT